MRVSHTRRSPLRRAFALTAAVGTLVLSGPVLPASAQESSTPNGPPELDLSKSAGSGPLSPLGGYEQKQGCMQANSGSSTIEEKPWSQRALGFEQAHSQGWTGAGSTIAVLDTGVNQHPRLPSIQDGGSNVPGGSSTDCDGHGTIVAGIAAARPDTDTGFIGVAPDAGIISLRQSSALYENEQEGKTIGDTVTMAQAINHAVQMGAKVVNISQSSCQPISSAKTQTGNAELQTAVHNAYRANVVVVAAAGNVGDACQKNPSGTPTTAVLPAWFDKYVLTVASVNQQGGPSEFTVPGPWVDVSAPGEGLISLDPGQGGSGLASQIATGEGEPGPIQGTSFAAPYVSGLVALIQQKEPNLSAEQVMERVKKTALHPGGDNGRNDIVGYGMIDPMAALNNVIPSEHGKLPAPYEKTRLGADAFPHRNWPALMIALGGAGSGIAAVAFTAFLVNAVRNVRARQAGDKD